MSVIQPEISFQEAKIIDVLPSMDGKACVIYSSSSSSSSSAGSGGGSSGTHRHNNNNNHRSNMSEANISEAASSVTGTGTGVGTTSRHPPSTASLIAGTLSSKVESVVIRQISGMRTTTAAISSPLPLCSNSQSSATSPPSSPEKEKQQQQIPSHHHQYHQQVVVEKLPTEEKLQFHDVPYNSSYSNGSILVSNINPDRDMMFVFRERSMKRDKESVARMVQSSSNFSSHSGDHHPASSPSTAALPPKQQQQQQSFSSTRPQVKQSTLTATTTTSQAINLSRWERICTATIFRRVPPTSFYSLIPGGNKDNSEQQLSAQLALLSAAAQQQAMMTNTRVSVVSNTSASSLNTGITGAQGQQQQLQQELLSTYLPCASLSVDDMTTQVSLKFIRNSNWAVRITKKCISSSSTSNSNQNTKSTTSATASTTGGGERNKGKANLSIIDCVKIPQLPVKQTSSGFTDVFKRFFSSSSSSSQQQQQQQQQNPANNNNNENDYIFKVPTIPIINNPSRGCFWCDIPDYNESVIVSLSNISAEATTSAKLSSEAANRKAGASVVSLVVEQVSIPQPTSSSSAYDLTRLMHVSIRWSDLGLDVFQPVKAFPLFDPKKPDESDPSFAGVGVCPTLLGVALCLRLRGRYFTAGSSSRNTVGDPLTDSHHHIDPNFNMSKNFSVSSFNQMAASSSGVGGAEGSFNNSFQNLSSLAALAASSGGAASGAGGFDLADTISNVTGGGGGGGGGETNQNNNNQNMPLMLGRGDVRILVFKCSKERHVKVHGIQLECRARREAPPTFCFFREARTLGVVSLGENTLHLIDVAGSRPPEYALASPLQSRPVATTSIDPSLLTSPALAATSTAVFTSSPSWTRPNSQFRFTEVRKGDRVSYVASSPNGYSVVRLSSEGLKKLPFPMLRDVLHQRCSQGLVEQQVNYSIFLSARFAPRPTLSEDAAREAFTGVICRNLQPILKEAFICFRDPVRFLIRLIDAECRVEASYLLHKKSYPKPTLDAPRRLDHLPRESFAGSSSFAFTSYTQELLSLATKANRHLNVTSSKISAEQFLCCSSSLDTNTNVTIREIICSASQEILFPRISDFLDQVANRRGGVGYSWTSSKFPCVDKPHEWIAKFLKNIFSTYASSSCSPSSASYSNINNNLVLSSPGSPPLDSSLSPRQHHHQRRDSSTSSTSPRFSHYQFHHQQIIQPQPQQQQQTQQNNNNNNNHRRQQSNVSVRTTSSSSSSNVAASGSAAVPVGAVAIPTNLKKHQNNNNNMSRNEFDSKDNSYGNSASALCNSLTSASQNQTPQFGRTPTVALKEELLLSAESSQRRLSDSNNNIEGAETNNNNNTSNSNNNFAASSAATSATSFLAQNQQQQNSSTSIITGSGSPPSSPLRHQSVVNFNQQPPPLVSLSSASPTTRSNSINNFVAHSDSMLGFDIPPEVVKFSMCISWCSAIEWIRCEEEARRLRLGRDPKYDVTGGLVDSKTGVKKIGTSAGGPNDSIISRTNNKASSTLSNASAASGGGGGGGASVGHNRLLSGDDLASISASANAAVAAAAASGNNNNSSSSNNPYYSGTSSATGSSSSSAAGGVLHGMTVEERIKFQHVSEIHAKAFKNKPMTMKHEIAIRALPDPALVRYSESFDWESDLMQLTRVIEKRDSLFRRRAEPGMFESPNLDSAASFFSVLSSSSASSSSSSSNSKSSKNSSNDSKKKEKASPKFFYDTSGDQQELKASQWLKNIYGK